MVTTVVTETNAKDKTRKTYHVIDRKDARTAFELTSPPVLVSTINNLDNITLLKRQLPRLGRFERMQCPHTRDDWYVLLSGLDGRT